MKVNEFITESTLRGTFVHETTTEGAAQIAKSGFKPSYEGIFFNRDDDGYSGGGYGGVQITAQLNISKMLDMAGDDLPDDLDEFADGEEIAAYARKHGYQAWADDLQIAVLDPRCIKIVSIGDSVTEGRNEWDESGSYSPASTRHMDPRINPIMLKKGYKRLGGGADAVAYLAPNGQVLKIFKTNQKTSLGYFSENQGMGIDWIRYCQANKSNPFLPKFSGLESFEFPESSGNMYLQIRMERLGKFPMKWEYELANMADAIDDQWINFDDYIDARIPTEFKAEDRAATLVMHLGKDGMKKLWDTMKALNRICEHNDWNWDMHSGNFMIRNDSTPVILDPYFLGYDR